MLSLSQSSRIVAHRLGLVRPFESGIRRWLLTRASLIPRRFLGIGVMILTRLLPYVALDPRP